MSFIDEIMDYNQQFVEGKRYEPYSTSKYPNKKIAILSCMDTRLLEILPTALNIKNGDAKLIKNAGAVVSHPFDSVMRSLIIAIYLLGVENVLVVGHHDCGMQGLEAEKIIKKMRERNISEENLNVASSCGTDLKKWLTGFVNVEDSVRETVNTIRTHPLIPADVGVYGFVIDPETGKLDRIV